jgi:outer membrane protein assembly factor BamB
MKLMRHLFLVITLVTGGCASDDETVPEWAGGDGKRAVEPAKLVEIVETAKFTKRWQYDLGSSGDNLLMPSSAGDAVYAASVGGALIRLDRATGQRDWRIDTGIQISGGVGGGEGLLLVGGNKGDVLAYDEAGLPRWKTKVSSEVLSAPQVSDGIVIVRGGDGHITGLSAKDGSQVWEYERSMPALVVRNHAGMVIQRGIAYAGFAGGKLAALNIADGSLIWEAAISQPRGSTELDRISDITDTPVVDDEQVCAIAFQGSIACVDIAQGTTLWNREISGDKGLMLLRGTLYFGDGKGLVYALDKTSGSTIWKNEKFFLREPATPYATEKHVVFGDFEGYLHVLNREDGRLAARVRLDNSAIKIPPIAAGDELLVQTSGGGLYALTLR